jgi:hypothetical protein
MHKTFIQVLFQLSSLLLVFLFAKTSSDNINLVFVYSLSSFVATWATYQVFSSNFLIKRCIKLLRHLSYIIVFPSILLLVIASIRPGLLTYSAISLAISSPFLFLMYDHMSSLALGSKKSDFITTRLAVIALAGLLLVFINKDYFLLALSVVGLRNIMLLQASDRLNIAYASSADSTHLIKAYQVKNPFLTHSLVPIFYYAPLTYIATSMNNPILAPTLSFVYTITQIQNSAILRLIDLKMKRLDYLNIDRLILMIFLVTAFAQIISVSMFGHSYSVVVVSLISSFLLWITCKYFVLNPKRAFSDSI